MAEVMPALAMAHDPAWESWVDSLSPVERLALSRAWDVWLRPEQHVPPWAWRICGFGGARGWGKSLGIALEINRRVEAGEERHVGLMAPNEDRVEEVQVKALIDSAPPWFRPEPYRGGVRWPNGVVAIAFTPRAPGGPRGENISLAWCTEIVAWDRATRKDAWDNLRTATRVGRAQILWDSTSKGRNELLQELYALNAANPRLYPIIGGTTFENPLLSYDYLRTEWSSYVGVRREEELLGKRFDEQAGALWRAEWIDRTRVEQAPPLEMRMAAVDPAISTHDSSDETGIVAGGRARDGHVYADVDRSGKYKPEEWGDIVIREILGARPGYVTIERKRIGDAAVSTLRSRASNVGLRVSVIGRDDPWPALQEGVVWVREQNSQDSKDERAQAPAAETEAGRVHLVGEFPDLERELTTWVPGAGRSPNRLDAFAYLVTELRDLTRDKADGSADVRAATRAQAALQAAINPARNPRPSTGLTTYVAPGRRRTI